MEKTKEKFKKSSIFYKFEKKLSWRIFFNNFRDNLVRNKTNAKKYHHIFSILRWKPFHQRKPMALNECEENIKGKRFFYTVKSSLIVYFGCY